jgi:hypothetical protein
MAKTLVSPGVSVEVINESFYAPSGPGTVPFIVIATQENKINPSNAIAAGTLKENAGAVYSIASKRELLNTFGTPVFPKTASGSSIYASEIAEYGLLAAHSVLDISSRAYVMRADIDLGQLVATGTQPTGAPAGGTLWLNTGTTSWGVFEWSAETEAFTKITPRVITSTDNLSGGVPLTSIGTIGEYAVVATNANNPVYYKNSSNQWILVGSFSWQNSIPAVTSANVNPTLISGNSIRINTQVVTLTGTNVSTLATNINNASITGITAEEVNGYLYIYVDGSATSDGSTQDGRMQIANVSGTPLTALGILAGFYAAPFVQLSSHTSVPQWKSFDAVPRPTGSVWVKTSAVANGAALNVYKYSSSTATWVLQPAPLYANDAAANRFLDPTRGGLGITINTLYVQYDVNENTTISYKIFERTSTSTTKVTGDANPTVVIGEEFELYTSIKGSSTMDGPYTVTMTGTDAESFVEDVLAVGATNINAYVNENGAPVIEHVLGGVIYLDDTSGTPLADVGITASSDFCRAGPSSNIIVSNWAVTDYSASAIAPVDSPADDTLWYYGSPLEADIMIHDGTNWRGYKNVSSDSRGYDLGDTDPNGPIISTTAPIQQTDGTALVYGDLWIDSSDLENYPKIYRYEVVSGEDKWVAIDTTNTTSENGIVFADARWDTDGTVDPVLDAKPAIIDLQNSDYTDLDCVDPSIYPRGVLLFNTRRSSYNVKEFKSDYFNLTNFPLEAMPTVVSTWVSVSGANSNGVPYFGRKAVRNMIVNAMQAAVDVSEEIREDSRFFNLIAAPGYPEMIPNMLALNASRRYTGFVVGDTPMGLASDATSVDNYITNVNNEVDDSESGLVSSDPYLAVYYPSAALTNDTTGQTVAVPMSHCVLRAIVKSDNSSFVWRAPAGAQRGLIDNASEIGYVERATGRFITVGTTEGLRDLLYQNNVNPVAKFANRGIEIYGQKTRAADASALDRINVARLVAYLRNRLEVLTKPFIFEPNDKITRNEVKQVIEQEMNELVATRGVYDYLVVCDESNNFPSRIDRNELYVDIAIEPTKAVEFIYIPVRLKNTGEIASGNTSSANNV